MAACNGCGERVDGSGRLCALCIAKMVNYAEGDYHDENDPAVKLYNKKRDEMNSPKSSQGGCAVVVLAAMAVPAFLAAAGVGLASLFG
ncbi:hypothetical protein AB0I28_27050 [Phytomonospora sp. NPDC050363]|uniref:hypothetical protein n=1 Tax=Phytomonospora sp. NPDC050363 TaxID=3155642 RepID=UPI0033EE71ED